MTTIASDLNAVEQVPLSLKNKISVSHVTGGGSTPVSVTLGVAYGRLDLVAGNSNVDSISGNGTKSVTIVGTVAQVNNLLGNNGTTSITYTPNTDAPPESVILHVGVSGDDAVGLKVTVGQDGTIQITAVNDAPVHNLPTSFSTIEGFPTDFAGGIFLDPPPTMVSDIDSALLTTRVTVADGALTLRAGESAAVSGLGTNDLLLSGTVAEVNLALYALRYTPADGVSGTRTITVTTSDGQVSDTDTIMVAIEDVGIAPAGEDATWSTDEDVPLVLGANHFPFSDDEGQALAGVVITTLPTGGKLLHATGISDDQDVDGDGFPELIVVRFELREGDEISHADLDAGLISYVPDPQVSGTDSFTFQVRDTGGATYGDNLDQTPNSHTIIVNAVNDTPTIADLDGDSVAYTEGDSPVRLDHGGNGLVSDLDNSDFDGGTLTVLIDGNGNDALVWNSSVVDVDGMTGGVSVSGVSIGSVSPVVVGAQFGLRIDLNALATPALVDQLIRGVAFTNHGDSPTAGTRTVTWTLDDGDGGTASCITSVEITPVNDTPWLTSAAPVTSVEQVPTAILAGVTACDLELNAKNHFLGDYAGATFSVSRDSSANAEDLFSLVAGAGFTIDGNRLEAGGLAFGTFTVSPTGSIIIDFTSSETPATGALVNAVIQSIRYANGSDTPPASVDLACSFTDGSPGGGQGAGASGLDVEMVTVNLTAVNDAPVNGLTPTQAGTEDTNLIFSAAGGNAITVGDAEATTLDVTISVAHGVLTLADTTDVVFAAGDGTGDATMTFGGTAAAINRALDGLVYRGNLNHSGLDSLTLTSSDRGGTGTGGILTDQDVITINLAADGLIDGDAGDNALTGTGGGDLFLFQQGGADEAQGGGGNDRFYFGDAFGTGDVADGGTGDDSLVLQGNYTLAFGSGQLSGIERLRLLDGGGAEFDYSLTTSDGNVAAGQQLRVDALDLRPGETLTFIGTAETDGTFWILGGAGDDMLVGGMRNDRLSGGGGNDTLYGIAGNDRLEGGFGADRLDGGAGADTLLVSAVTESTGAGFDTLSRFEARIDRIDLPVTVARWNGTVTSGSLTHAGFNTQLAAAVDSVMQASGAVLFKPNSGDFSGVTFAIVDADGDGAYTTGADYVFGFVNPVEPLTSFNIFT